MKKDVVLEIYLDESDPDEPKPDVRCVDGRDCEEGSAATVWRDKRVEWKAADAGATWTVMFLDSMGPFKKNRRFFHPDKRKERLRDDVPNQSTFDYCVSYQRPSGGPVYHSDPKITVRDAPFLRRLAFVAGYHEDIAESHRVLSVVQAEIQELHAELAERLNREESSAPPPGEAESAST